MLSRTKGVQSSRLPVAPWIIGFTPFVSFGQAQAAPPPFDKTAATGGILPDHRAASVRATAPPPKRYVMTRDALTIDLMASMARKDDAAFRKGVTDEIHHLIAQGDINALYRKWFESPIPPKQANLKLPTSHLLHDSFKSPTEWLP